MARETVEVLEEIAALLRQYVEHTTELSKRAQERLDKLRPPKTLDVSRDMKALERKSEAAARRRSAEERAFRKQLLTSIDGHNRALAQLLRTLARDRAAKPAKRKTR